MNTLKKTIESEKYESLIFDGRIPTITLGLIKEEFMLYNLSSNSCDEIIKEFNIITKKQINENYKISELSHGQKILLSTLIGLNTNATKILFNNFFTSLSNNNKNIVTDMIQNKILEGKIIQVK